MPRALSRRALLRGVALASGALASGALLAACGASGAAVGGTASTAAPATASTAPPTTAATTAAASASAPATTSAVAAQPASTAAVSTAAVSTSASSVAPSAAAKAAPLAGKVRFSHVTGKVNEDVFGKLASQFNAQNPGVQVATEATWEWDNNKYIVQASGGDAADVVWTDETYDTQLFIADATRDLDSFLAKDAQFKPADYFDTVMAAYKFQGKMIGLPMLWGAYVMYYNKTLFDRAGRQPPDGTWTWDTFLENAKALTQPSSDPSAMGQYGFETRDHQNVWSPWVWGAGGDLFSADGLKCTMATPEAIAGIQYVLDLMHKWKVAPKAKELSDRKLGSNAFGMTGKIGMAWNAIYYLPTYRKSQGFDWDIAPIPKGPKGYATTNPTDGLAMWKGTRAPDTAWAFMRYLVSEEAESTYVTSEIAGMPVHKTAAQLILKDPRPPKNKQVYYDAFSYAKPAFTTPYGQHAIDILHKDGKFQDMWNQGLPAQDVLTTAMPIVNQAIQAQVNAKSAK